MQTYFVLVALKRFGEIKRQVGYTRAMSLIEEVRDAIAAAVPDARSIRSNRETAEFTVTCLSADTVELRLQQLGRSLTGEVQLRGGATERGACIAAVRCRSGRVTEEVVEQAEILLRQAQRDGRAIMVSDAEIQQRDDYRLMGDLRCAIQDGGLSLVYQPKLRSHTGEIAGAEALMRWNHPLIGPVAPDIFIPMAERSGDIRGLTAWVYERAVADQAILRNAGLALTIHVNVSGSLIGERDFADLALSRLAGQDVGLEITETAVIADPEGAIVSLKRLADAGLHLAIDDYGSGFSSLAYLQRLPVHELKIDKIFTSRLTNGARDPLLVRSTIDLAHALEMEVTAEGVETAAQLALLQAMRCDLVQGYFLSHPLSLGDFVTYANKRAEGPALPKPISLRERLANRRSEAGEAA